MTSRRRDVRVERRIERAWEAVADPVPWSGMAHEISTTFDFHGVVLLLDEKCRVVMANESARNPLAEKPELRKVVGRLSARDSAVSARLTQLIEKAVRRAEAPLAADMLRIARSGRFPVVLAILPSRASSPGTAQAKKVAAVCIRDPETAALSRHAVCETFGLTPAEASVASALAEGKALRQIASAAGIGIGTARSHLKRALAKTGTRQQSQLVSLLLRSIPLERRALPATLRVQAAAPTPGSRSTRKA